MATHGCLLIESHNRQCMLHTYHTGQDIPDVPPKVFDTLVDYFFYINASTEEEALDAILRTAILDRLQYAPSTAAMFIAAKPCYLEPVTRGNRKDLPSWSGIDSPFKLKMRGRTWRLYDQDGELIKEYDIVDEVVARLLARPNEEDE